MHEYTLASVQYVSELYQFDVDIPLNVSIQQHNDISNHVYIPRYDNK